MTAPLTQRQIGGLWGLLAAAVIVRLVTLGAYPLVDPTEARYAEIARKMLDSGDWITQQFAPGVPFWGKPPLSTWLTAASMAVFGVNEFGARLPSFLLLAGCGALVYALARWRGGRDAALVCAVLFATTGLVFVSAGSVMTDPALVAGTTLVMAGYWGASRGPPSLRAACLVALFAGVAVGLLAKGPIAGVLSLGAIALWFVTGGRAAKPSRAIPWLPGLAASALLVVPWFWLQERATPGFLSYFLVGEHWMRFTHTGWTGDLYGAAHAWPRGSVWVMWLVAALPWSPVAVAWTLRALLRRREDLAAVFGDPWRRYLLAWMVLPLVFFTASANVLVTYVLPGLPAFALLVGDLLLARVPVSRAARSRDVVVVGLAGTGTLVAFAVVLVAGHQALEERYSQRALVQAWQDGRSPGERLIYLHTPPPSASFYTRGTAVVASTDADLVAYLRDGHRDWIVRQDEPRAVSERAGAGSEGHAFGHYRLTREAPPAVPNEPLAPGDH